MSKGPHYSIGPYLGKITSQALGETQTGKPQFALRFLVLGGIDPADPNGDLIECKQYERTMYRVITDKTIEYLIEDLNKLEFTGSSFKELDPETPGFCDFSGKEIAFYCNHEADQEGNIREKWGLSRGASKLEVKPLEGKKVRELDALFGKALKGASKKPAATPKPKQAEETVPPSGDDDSDIPF